MNKKVENNEIKNDELEFENDKLEIKGLNKCHFDKKINDVLRNFYPDKKSSFSISEDDKPYAITVPDWQRNFVWSNNKKSQFIESILLGFVTPEIVVASETNGGPFILVDGLQRLTTLYEFMSPRCPEKHFKLKSLETENLKKFEGKSYEEIKDSQDQDSKNFIERLQQLTIGVVEQYGCDSQKMLLLFKRLNSGGMQLNGPEILRAVYDSPYVRDLYSLSDSLTEDFISGKSNERGLLFLHVLGLAIFLETGNVKLWKPKGRMKFLEEKAKSGKTMEELSKDNRFVLNKKLFDSVIKIYRQLLYFGKKNNREYGKWETKPSSISEFFYYSTTIARAILKNDSSLSSFLSIPDNIQKVREIQKRIHLEDQNWESATTNASTRPDNLEKGFESIKPLEDILCGALDKKRSFTKKAKEELKLSNEYCGICKEPIEEGQITEIDHKKPWSLGGKSEISNAQLVHATCNRAKSNKFQQN